MASKICGLVSRLALIILIFSFFTSCSGCSTEPLKLPPVDADLAETVVVTRNGWDRDILPSSSEEVKSFISNELSKCVPIKSYKTWSEISPDENTLGSPNTVTLIYPNDSQFTIQCFMMDKSIVNIMDNTGISPGEERLYLVNDMWLSNFIETVTEMVEQAPDERYADVAESPGLVYEFHVMTDDNAPIGCEFGTDRGRQMDTLEMLSELETLQGFIFPANSGITLRFFYTQEPEDVYVRYIAEEKWQEPYLYENQRIQTPGEPGVYNFFVDIHWDGENAETVFFSVTVKPEAEVSSGHETSSEPEPSAADPFKYSPLSIHIVDETGEPVANISGVLELGVATADSAPPGVGLSGRGADGACTGNDGNLYFTDSADLIPFKGTLILSAYYDSSIKQSMLLTISEFPTDVLVTWTGGTPPSKAADPASRRITFRIVDEKGSPVANVSGGLEQTAGSAVGYRLLSGGQDLAASDESGNLYLELETGWEKREQSRIYTLKLYGYFDNSLQQEYEVELKTPPASYTITWALPHPPKERPPQTTGLRLFIVDAQGNPVQGVELTGSPYPKETTGPIPDIAMILGPSDKQGYIRWDDAKPGAYEPYGSKDGKSQKYEIRMPEGKAMADLTLTWSQ